MMSYAGKLLRVDLSDRRISTQPTSDYSEMYLGGRGMATRIYWDECHHKSAAFDPDVPLIIALGPLAGVPAVGGSRWGIFSKTALHNPHRFCHGNLGGTFGAELKFAGYDGIVITGKAESPAVLCIDDSDVILRSADDLKGLKTTEVIERLKSGKMTKAKILCAGPAGERGITYATAFADGDASCSGGIGASMGAKNLKAVIVRGGKRVVETHNPGELRRLARTIKSFGRGNVKVWGLDFMASGSNVKKLPCAGCMASCLRVEYKAENGVAGKYMCQSRVFYLPYALEFYGTENDVPFLANRLCDEYGIDTWKLQEIVDWLDRCRREKLLTDKEAGFPLSKIGSLEFIEGLLESITMGRDLGGLLSIGLEHTAATLGSDFVSQLKRADPYDPRYCTVNALLFPFDTREPIQQLHEAGLVLSQWSSWAQGVEGAHISTDVVREIGKVFWGSRKAADFTTLEGKAEAAYRIQNRQLAKESLVVCDWMYPVIDNPNGDGHLGDPSFESRILSAATGIEYDETSLNLVGERIFNLQRAIMVREGHRPAEDDLLPSEWHTVPLDGHVADPQCMVPGSGGRRVSRIGSTLSLRDYKRLRAEFYHIRKWDVRSGLQGRKQLHRLGLSDIADELLKNGKAAVKAGRLGPIQRIQTWLLYRWRAVIALIRVNRRVDPVSPKMTRDDLLELLEGERRKYGDPKIADSFAGWNKVMRYQITDFGEDFYFLFHEGTPEWFDESETTPKTADVSYRIDSATLQAMAKGELSGFQAYKQGMLKISASFADMMKLQGLSKV